MEIKSGVQKLQEFLKEKFPQVNDKEIEKVAENLLEIGFFIVRVKREHHSKEAKPNNFEGLRRITRKPP